MQIVAILLPFSLFLALCGVCAYYWAVKNDQFEDLDTPARRILFDDEENQKPS